MQAYEEHGRSIVTLILDAVGVDNDGSVRSYVNDMDRVEMIEALVYLGGWVSGHFDSLADWQTHLRQIDAALGP